MPTEGFDGIGQLFISNNKGNYVPLMDVKEESIVREEEPFDQYELMNAVREMKDRIQMREEQTYNAILMNDSVFLTLMMNGYIQEIAKDFWYCGLRVITSIYIPIDQVFLTTVEYVEKIIRQFLPNYNTVEESEEQEVKKEPKQYHCRVCGAVYYDKSEAKNCMRNHSWQNRKGRH